MTTLPNTAALAIDLNKCFVPGTAPGYGELPAPDGDQVIAPLVAIAALVDLYAATGDAHTLDHSSFTANGGPWPPHGRAGTPGGELVPEIAAVMTPGWFFAKGVTSDVDAYSAFEVTDLAERLREAGITRLLAGGLVTNVCVLASVLDALREGFEVDVLTDACRGIDAPGLPTPEEAFAQMAAAGATLTTSRELLAAAALDGALR